MSTSATSTFPFRTTLSLARLFDFWQTVGHDPDSPRAAVARQIQQRLEDAPELALPIENPSLLDQHRDLLDLMMVAIFPAALWEQTIMAVSAPFDMRPFYSSPSFDRLSIFESGCPEHMRQDDFTERHFIEMRALYACYWILQEHYQVALPAKRPMTFMLTDEKTGLDKYYKFDMDASFASIKTHGTPKKLSGEQIERLLAEPYNLPLWLDHLPPENFEFQGFIVLTATDVTDHAVLSGLKDDLLQKDAMTSPERIDHLQRRIRSLLGQPDLDLGLICLESDHLHGLPAGRPVGRSLLLDNEAHAPACPYWSKSFYAQVYNHKEAFVVSDLDSCEVCTGYEHHLREHGFRTLLLAPLRFEGSIIGILELASPRPNAINALMATKLGEAISLFATAMKRSLDEQEDRIQAIIKEQYTAIHPTVEWKFRKVAQAYLEHKATDRPERIVFKDVYPLYGLSDIRNSSSTRNKAIQDDLLEQLSLAHNVIVEAAMDHALPSLDQVGFRIRQYADRIAQGASTEDETTVLAFLRREVEPLFALFDRRDDFGPRVMEQVERYNKALDNEHRFLYRQRRDFEHSVEEVNEHVAAYLKAQDEQAQQDIVPHYFEMFKTDGVDYNIYVGASLADPTRTPVSVEDIDLFHLRDMRIWQLKTMCGVEWALRKLKPTLRMPLDATHLILVQSVPLSIRFREEEKQFDVDGAYNIRYEIVKKRIDKAFIKDTRERLTQPGKIAIVYSQTQEAVEYRQYLDYLHAAGYINGEIETFELEPMQGVYGLKALRVTVSETIPETDIDIGQAPEAEASRQQAVPS